METLKLKLKPHEVNKCAIKIKESKLSGEYVNLVIKIKTLHKSVYIHKIRKYFLMIWPNVPYQRKHLPQSFKCISDESSLQLEKNNFKSQPTKLVVRQKKPCSWLELFQMCINRKLFTMRAALRASRVLCARLRGAGVCWARHFARMNGSVFKQTGHRSPLRENMNCC